VQEIRALPLEKEGREWEEVKSAKEKSITF
jgi:hypothetical protein